MKFIKHIINVITYKLKTIFSHMTPKGECALRYYKDILAGKEVYISAYENTLKKLMEELSVDREEAAELLVQAFTDIKGE